MVEHKSSCFRLVYTEYCEILFQTWQILGHLCLQWAQNVGFSRTLCEVFSVLITPFWGVILYSLVHRCQCLGGNLCLLLLNLEDEDIRFLQNVAIHKWHNTVSHNISVSFEVLSSRGGADVSTLLEFTLCRMVNSCQCLKDHNASIFRVRKKKVKCPLVQALSLCTSRTAHRRIRGIALLFLDHGTRRGWGVSIMPRLLFTPGKDPVPTV
jgi:hypothetical protein